MTDDNKQVKYLVRIANTDINGKKPLYMALTKIRGISYSLSNVICEMLDLDKTQQIGTIDDSEIIKLTDFIQNLSQQSIPSWLLNRRNDYETGKDVHLIGGNVRFVRDLDLKRLQRIKSYRGLRLTWGLTVRGQRTKSNFRNKRSKSLGVKKKKGKSGRN